MRKDQRAYYHRKKGGSIRNGTGKIAEYYCRGIECGRRRGDDGYHIYRGYLGADSLDVFQILMGVEEAFDIEIQEEDAEQIVSVGDAVEAIRKAIQ